MEAFATADQYRDKYADDIDDDALEEWLGDASAVIRGELDASGIPYDDPSEQRADALMRACRDMVHRAIADDGPAIPFGATQMSMTGGPYSRSFSLGNPYDSLFMTAAEKRMLGIGVERACVISPYGGA